MRYQNDLLDCADDLFNNIMLAFDVTEIGDVYYDADCTVYHFETANAQYKFTVEIVNGAIESRLTICE